MLKLPRFSTLVSNYPKTSNKPTKTLLDEIGGQVRTQLSDSINTCAIRMSVALNRSHSPIRPCGQLYMLTGKTPPHPSNPRVKLAPSRYLVRAKEMRTYLDHEFGVGRLVYDGSRQIEPTFSPGQKQGIICFDWVGPWAGFQAGGHVDLLRLVVDTAGKVTRLLPNCEGHCYFLPTLGPMRAYFWGTDP